MIPFDPPQAVGTGEADRAGRAGRYAALVGLPVTACPWHPAGTAVDKQLAAAFVRSYLKVRPPLTVDYVAAE